MKNKFVALAASALLGFGSLAIAEEPVKGPVTLSDKQMDNIVAGDPGVYDLFIWACKGNGPCGEYIARVGYNSNSDNNPNPHFSNLSTRNSGGPSRKASIDLD